MTARDRQGLTNACWLSPEYHLMPGRPTTSYRRRTFHGPAPQMLHSWHRGFPLKSTRKPADIAEIRRRTVMQRRNPASTGGMSRQIHHGLISALLQGTAE